MQDLVAGAKMPKEQNSTMLYFTLDYKASERYMDLVKVGKYLHLTHHYYTILNYI